MRRFRAGFLFGVSRPRAALRGIVDGHNRIRTSVQARILRPVVAPNLRINSSRQAAAQAAVGHLLRRPIAIHLTHDLEAKATTSACHRPFQKRRIPPFSRVSAEPPKFNGLCAFIYVAIDRHQGVAVRFRICRPQVAAADGNHRPARPSR